MNDLKWIAWSSNIDIWGDDLMGLDSDHFLDIPKEIFHREDGPFIRIAGGTYGWWLDGEHYSINDYLKANKTLTDEEKALMILVYA